MAATATSLKAAALTVLVATPIGALAAYALHTSTVPWVRAAFVLLIAPMMVPVILIAIGAFYVYVQASMLYTLGGLVLAHSMLAIPLVTIVVGASRMPARSSTARSAAERWVNASISSGVAVGVVTLDAEAPRRILEARVGVEAALRRHFLPRLRHDTDRGWFDFLSQRDHRVVRPGPRLWTHRLSRGRGRTAGARADSPAQDTVPRQSGPGL